MANLFVSVPVYVSLEDFKDSTDGSLALENDSTIKTYIGKAEILIDSLIGKYGEKLEQDQPHIFPTVIEGIPENIKKACILLSDSLYKNRYNLDRFYNIQQETRRGNSVSYDTATQNKFKSIHPCLNNEIYTYLEKYFAIDKTKSVFFRT